MDEDHMDDEQLDGKLEIGSGNKAHSGTSI